MTAALGSRHEVIDLRHRLALPPGADDDRAALGISLRVRITRFEVVVGCATAVAILWLVLLKRKLRLRAPERAAVAASPPAADELGGVEPVGIDPNGSRLPRR